MKLSIDSKKCPAQDKICPVIPACPTGAVHYVADSKERLGGRIVIDDALCNECRLCVSVCCGHAIALAE